MHKGWVRLRYIHDWIYIYIYMCVCVCVCVYYTPHSTSVRVKYWVFLCVQTLIKYLHLSLSHYVILRYRDPFHKSHNALDEYPTMHHFVTEMCMHMHISVTKWCIMGLVHCGICESYQLARVILGFERIIRLRWRWHKFTVTTKISLWNYVILRYRDPFHKSHNALDEYPTMHHFVTEMCMHMHISVTKWCIMGLVHCGICESYQLARVIMGFERIIRPSWRWP